MEQEQRTVDYEKLSNFWNSIPVSSGYAINYLMDHEDLAEYRFQKDCQFVLDNLPSKQHTFLDLGCGNGNLIATLAPFFEHTDGIDFSARSMSIAQKRFKYHPTINLRVENVADAQFDKTYDLVNIAELLMYLADDDILRLLSRISAALTSAGKVTVRESVATKKTMHLYNTEHETKRRVLPCLLALFAEAGLYPIKVEHDYYYNYVWMTHFYFKRTPKLLRHKKFIIFFLNNPVTRFVFLFLPFWLMVWIRKNSFIHYYFVFAKNKSVPEI